MMRTLLIFLAFLSCAEGAWAAGLPVNVASALRDQHIAIDTVSVFVQRVDQDQPLIAINSAQPMNPASSMKLLTTYAALELLGPAYTWKTEAYADEALDGDVLRGNLVLKGYGDPSLSLSGFWELLRSLRKSGLREIKGDLVLDRSYFDPILQDAGAFDGEPYRAYNAAPDALLVNFKATRFDFKADVQQHRIVISAEPDFPQISINNHVEMRAMPCSAWKDRIRYQVERDAGKVHVTFDGDYSPLCGEKSLTLAVLDDDEYLFSLFKQLWQQLGGSLVGLVRAGSVPQGAKLLANANSPPLAEVVRMVNKNSNNLMARQLLLTLGADQVGSPGNVDKGVTAVRRWIKVKGLDFPELVLENGSGLSRQERISAAHLGDLLLAAWRSPVMPEVMSSLPVLGVDGTLENRLRGSDLAGQVHMKTGSLDGVRSFAGYLLDSKGRRWVVVFMVNHERAALAKEAQNALLEWLYKRD